MLLRKLFYFLLPSLVLMMSCDLNDIDDPRTIINISDEFVVSPWENLDASERQFQLRTETIEPTDCEEATIEMTLISTGNRLYEVSINDIKTPNDCTTGDHIATGAVSFAQLETGDYRLRLNLKEGTVVNEGMLRVTDAVYTVEMNTTHGIRIERNTLLRIPERTLWGQVSFADDATSTQQATRFLEELNQLTEPLDLNQGDYGYFRITSEDEVVIARPAPFSEVSSFVAKYSMESTEALTQLVDRYRDETNEEKLEIQLFDWRGKQY